MTVVGENHSEMLIGCDQEPSLTRSLSTTRSLSLVRSLSLSLCFCLPHRPPPPLCLSSETSTAGLHINTHSFATDSTQNKIYFTRRTTYFWNHIHTNTHTHTHTHTHTQTNTKHTHRHVYNSVPIRPHVPQPRHPFERAWHLLGRFKSTKSSATPVMSAPEKAVHSDLWSTNTWLWL